MARMGPLLPIPPLSSHQPAVARRAGRHRSAEREVIVSPMLLFTGRTVIGAVANAGQVRPLCFTGATQERHKSGTRAAQERRISVDPVCTANQNLPFAPVLPEKIVLHDEPTFFCNTTGRTNWVEIPD